VGEGEGEGENQGRESPSPGARYLPALAWSPHRLHPAGHAPPSLTPSCTHSPMPEATARAKEARGSD
jgi:hypothetical protein